MCGIVAAIANNNVTEILLKGLKYLEYRGYDSAGIAMVSSNNLTCFKEAGKVKKLCDSINTESNFNIGIAHTRWATHGAPTKDNAHPHISNNKIAIVHNGIIENHQEIKQELLQQGYKFISETDSEVICHLFHHYSNENSDAVKILTAVSHRLKGSFAIAAIDSSKADKIFAICHDSPLILAKGEAGNYIASDQIALIEVAKDFIYLKDRQSAIISANTINVFDKNGDEISPKIERLELEVKSNNLKNHKHYMHKEIHEQPAIVDDIIKFYFQEKNNEVLQLINKVIDCKAAHIIGCGTSYNAALLAQYWLEDLARITTSTMIASEYRYHNTPVNPDTVFICISQSGETADTLAALRLAKTKGYKLCIAYCNNNYSSIAREADICMPILAGKEVGVASTKAFTAQSMCLLHLAISLAPQSKKIIKITNQITSIRDLIITAVSTEDKIIRLAKKLVNVRHVIFLGRNLHYPIAEEGALKFKELTYSHAHAYPAGELKHGPLALVDERLYTVFLLPNNNLLEKNLSNMQEIEARGGKIICITEQGIDKRLITSSEQIWLPECDSALSPIIHCIALQFIAYYVALLRGNDVDQPRNLAKSVTVE